MEPLELESAGDAGFLLPEDHERFEAYQAPGRAQYVLASSLDGLSLLRRDLKGLLDARDLERKVYGDRGMVPLSGVADLPSHPIFDRGRIVGLWEYDPAAESIAWLPLFRRTRICGRRWPICRSTFAPIWAMRVRSAWIAPRAARREYKRCARVRVSEFHDSPRSRDSKMGPESEAASEPDRALLLRHVRVVRA